MGQTKVGRSRWLMTVTTAAALALTACEATPADRATSTVTGDVGSHPSSTSPPGRQTPQRQGALPRAACPGSACVTLSLTGDVLLHSQLWGQAQRDAAVAGSSSLYDFRPLLAQQQPLIAGTDLAFCHLETPVGTATGPFHGYPLFTVPPQVLPALRSMGYDACTTASNHTMDAGTAGVTRTLTALDKAGLRHVGSARSAAEAKRPAIFDVRGTRVALLAYAYGLNGTAPGARERWRVNLINAPRILRDAAAAHRAGADLVVVALHWGTEYVVQPTAEQLAVTRQLLAGKDIDLLYGHHSHVVQPVERIDGRWVVYGLGNTVAAQAAKRVETQEGLLVQVQFVRDATGRWTSPTLRWVPSFTASHRPYRWVDLRHKGSGHQDSRRRIAEVVTSRGADAEGAAELPGG